MVFIKGFLSRYSYVYHTNQEVNRQEISQYCPPNINSPVKVPQQGAKYLSSHLYQVLNTLF